MMKPLWKNMELFLSRMVTKMQSLDYHVIDQVLIRYSNSSLFNPTYTNSIFQEPRPPGYTMGIQPWMKILSTSFGIPIKNCTCGPSMVPESL